MRIQSEHLQRTPARNSQASHAIETSTHNGAMAEIHRAIGNHAFGRLIQAKLKVNEPGDEYERDADRMAEMVTRMPETGHAAPMNVQRKCAKCESGGAPCPKCAEEEEKVQRKSSENGQGSPALTAEVESQIDKVRSGGRPLSPSARAFFEPRFGEDLGGVRVHANASATASARSINARAYTVGRDVVMDPQEYAPEKPEGMKLLAHELTHVIQQRGSSPPAVAQREERKPETAGTSQPQEKKEAGEVITEGLGIVAENLDENNPEFKKLKEAVKGKAKEAWRGLPGGEKGALLGFGAATLGTLGATLTDKKAREGTVDFLEGKNLAIPLQLIPHMPITGLSFERPKPEAGERNALVIDTKLTAAPLFELVRKRNPNMPPIDVEVDFKLGFDSKSGDVNLAGGTIKIGLFEGLKLSAGTTKEISPYPQVFPTATGGTVISKASIPGPEPIKTPPGFEVMVSADLVKLFPKVFK